MNMVIRRWLLVVGRWSLATASIAEKEKASTMPRPKALREIEMLLRFERLNHHELAHLSAVHEFNAACDLGEERVVFAFADIQARFHARAALPDDDRAAGDKLSAECLKAKALRV
jgi:hypothetical protein